MFPPCALRPDREADAERAVQHRLRQEDLVRRALDAPMERAVQVVMGRETVFICGEKNGLGEDEAEDRECEAGGSDELEGRRGADEGDEVLVQRDTLWDVVERLSQGLMKVCEGRRTSRMCFLKPSTP